MQSKLKFILYIISILLFIAMFFECIYIIRQYKPISEQNETIHISNETIQQINNTIETEIDKEVDIQVVKPVNLGEFKLTAYCSCAKCCGKWANNRPNGVVYGAIGEELKEGYSIAVDPNVIPYRSEIIIDGKTYKAQDCGGAIKGNRIDVYFEDHNDALEFGVQYAEVFIKL